MRLRLPLNIPLAVTIVCWGFNFVALKLVYREMSAPALSLVRWGAMFAVLVAWCAFRGESLRYPRGSAARILLSGFLSMGLYMVLFLEGMTLTTPAEGAILLATAPIFTYLFSCAVRQEKLAAAPLIGSFVAFIGVAIVVLGGTSEVHGSLRGNLIILASAVAWAVGVVVTRTTVEDVSPVRVLTLGMPGALPILAIYGLSATLHTDYRQVSPFGWLMFGHVAILSGVLAFACFYTGIRQVGAAVATLYQFLTPICATLFAWLVLRQSLNWIQGLGMAVVIAGVGGASLSRLRA